MKYTVTADFYLDEAAVQLTAGDVIKDGDLEPDVIAQLCSQGTLASDAPPVVDTEKSKRSTKH